MKHLITLLICTTFLNGLLGQVTIQSNELAPVEGETFTVKNTNWSSAGPSGNDVTWDLSSLQEVSTTEISHQAPDPTFSPSNIEQVRTTGTQVVTSHLETSQSGQYYHGIETNTTTIVYQDAMKTIAFPLNSSVNEVDNFSATFTVNGIPFTRAGTCTMVADGYGTLITPDGTFTDVIRLKIVQDFTDTYSQGTIDTEITEYHWYKAGYHYPLALIAEVTSSAGPSQSSGQYFETTGVGVEDLSKDLVNVYPNPASSDITFELPSELDVTTIEIYNSVGKKVLDADVKVVKANISIVGLDSGVYSVRFLDDQKRAVLRSRFVKE